MVRIKHRYLLVDILYPSPATTPPPSSSSSRLLGGGDAGLRSHLQIHAPTSDALTPGLLAKMVREEVAEMFGDWGVGRLGGAGGGGVSGMFSLFPFLSCLFFLCLCFLWVSLACFFRSCERCVACNMTTVCCSCVMLLNFFFSSADLPNFFVFFSIARAGASLKGIYTCTKNRHT